MDAYHLPEKTSQTNSNLPINFHSKPVIIYYFIDPFHSDYSLTDIHLKKLTIEYGRFIQIRPVIRHKIIHVSKNRNDPNWNRHFLSISMLAATLQGNRAGRDFLRYIQQSIFLYYEHVQHSKEILASLIEQAAVKANLDLHEFYRDLFSDSVNKAYQSDVQLIREMEVTQYPTLVFYSQHTDDYGIKIAGMQNYETYTFILEDILKFELQTVQKLSLEDSFQLFKRLRTEDVAFMYDYSLKEAEKKIKKLRLQRIVKEIEINGFRLWEYSG